MAVFTSFSLLLLVSLLCQGHADVSAQPSGHHCALDACDYPEDDTDPNFCRQAQTYVRCVKENILSNTVCSRLEKAGAATMVIRLKLDHKECLLNDIADKGIINEHQADTASKVYRKDGRDIEESDMVEVQVCGWYDPGKQDNNDDAEQHSQVITEVCESFQESVDIVTEPQDDVKKSNVTNNNTE